LLSSPAFSPFVPPDDSPRFINQAAAREWDGLPGCWNLMTGIQPESGKQHDLPMLELLQEEHGRAGQTMVYQLVRFQAIQVSAGSPDTTRRPTGRKLRAECDDRIQTRPLCVLATDGAGPVSTRFTACCLKSRARSGFRTAHHQPRRGSAVLQDQAE
jgi:hypothetical protein